MLDGVTGPVVEDVHSPCETKCPGMRIPQEEKKLAPGNLWPKEGEEPGEG